MVAVWLSACGMAGCAISGLVIAPSGLHWQVSGPEGVNSRPRCASFLRGESPGNWRRPKPTPPLLFRRCRSLKVTLGVGAFGLFYGRPKDRRQFHARLGSFRKCRDTRPKDASEA